MQLLGCAIWIRCGQAYGTLLLNQSCELHAVGLQCHCNPLTQLERHWYATPHAGPDSFQSAASSWLWLNWERPTSGSPCFKEVLFAFQFLFRKEPGRSTGSYQWSGRRQQVWHMLEMVGPSTFSDHWFERWHRHPDMAEVTPGCTGMQTWGPICCRGTLWYELKIRTHSLSN